VSPKEVYEFITRGNTKLNYNPVVVGSGAAGLFCDNMLSLNGYKPIIIERGEKVEDKKTLYHLLELVYQ